MSSEGFKNVPGVPDGWELVAIRHPVNGDFYVYRGLIYQWENSGACYSTFPIIRKVETPKRFRPFANGEEFKPHRDRWVRRVSDGLVFRCTSYGGGALVVFGSILPSFPEAFEQFVFDDGTPFGVEVTSE
jgi:hypothetical protein